MSKQTVPHFWMVLGQVQFVHENEQKGIMANVLAHTPEQKFNHVALDAVHREFARRVVEEFGINPNDITNIVMHNVNWLGQMAPEEMFGPAPTEPAASEAPVHPAQQ